MGFELREASLPVRYDDVPWPPSTSCLLSAMAASELTAAKKGLPSGREGSPGTSKEAFVAHKRAYKRAHLRWHPDKFQQRLLLVEDQGDKERILSQVMQISQQINAAWEKLKNA